MARKTKKTSAKKSPATRYTLAQPMRIQARPGSPAEKAYYANSSLPGFVLPMPKVIAPGISPDPLEDLLFHGGMHIQRNGKNITLYYSANVFSKMLSAEQESGIVAFDQPWKNVVGTLYHEINEFRTDADVKDAIEARSNDFPGWSSRIGRECGDQPVFAATSLELVYKEVVAGQNRIPVQFMYSNAVHGAEGPIAKPHA